MKNFLLVAQEENITRASEILHISQPTLSRQIQNLEEEFGQPLFLRNNKKVTLTNNGKLLQQRAAEIIELYEKTHSEINPTPGIVSGDIRLAISEASVVKNIFEAGKKFQSEYPLTRFRAFNGDNNSVIDMINTGLVDFGLLFGYVDDKQFSYYQIAEKESIGILMPKGHPLCVKESIELDDLEGYPIIIHQDSVRRLPRSYDNYFEGLEFRATFTMLITAVKMVEAGLGIAIIPDSVIGPGSDALVTRPFSRPMSVPTFLAWKKNGILPKQSLMFLDMLRENM